MVGKIGLVTLFIGIIGITGQFGPKMGPYVIEVEKLEQCEDQGSRKIVFSSRITSGGRGKYYYNENFTIKVPADEKTKGRVEVQKWGNGGWRPKTFLHTIKNCEALWKMAGDHIKAFMKATGVEKCPIPVGEYRVDNWAINLTLADSVPMMEYGRYRVIIKMFYEEEFVGCIMAYVEIVPKASG